MNDPEPLVAGIELGGTKCIAAVARGGTIVRSARWPTGDPVTTLAQIVTAIAAWHAAEPLAAIGIGAFGPLDLDPASPGLGRIGATPKPGWSGTDVLGAFAARFGVPIGIDTDVGGAALAEGRWGGAVGCATHVYVTIGTGIGAGIVANGRVLHGMQHPEAGHLRVRRDPADSFAGICPFHGDCLEGLASGPAIAARAGAPADGLDGGHPVWSRVAAEIAELVAALMLVLSPERVVLGGGVLTGRPELLEAIRVRTAACLGGYLAQHSLATLRSVVVASPLGEAAGTLGAVAIALDALAASASAAGSTAAAGSSAS